MTNPTTTKTTALFGHICNYATGEAIREANSTEWEYARENGDKQTGAFADVFETGETVFCDGPAELTVDMAREMYCDRFADGGAVEFEEQVLSAGREFLPDVARAIVDGYAATVAYYAWLIDQHAEWQHDAAVAPSAEELEAEREITAALEAVKVAHGRATNKWAGREWDDGGDVIDPNMTDETIVGMLDDPADLRVTSWGIPDDGDYPSQTWRRNVRAAAEDLAQAVSKAACKTFTDGKADDEAVHEECAYLRTLARLSDDGVRMEAERAEAEAKAALAAVLAGKAEEALEQAAEAASIERAFGDAPTWGPFEAAVRAWAELVLADDEADDAEAA